MTMKSTVRPQAAEGFDDHPFTWDSTTRRVLRRGSGPGVLVMHELPGLSPACLRLAARIAKSQFTVHVPLLFGEVGEFAIARNVARLCVSREFSLLAAHGPSPVTDWLRALCRDIHAQCGGPGIGVIGMCLTGGFVLSMMLEPAVLAAVAAEPSLPLVPCTEARKRAIGVPKNELAQARRRAATGVDLLGLRFSEDRKCPPQRFDALQELLGPRFRRIDIPSQPGNRFGIPRRAHSVLTENFVDREGHPTHDALMAALALLDEHLKPAAGSNVAAATPPMTGL